MPGGAPRAQEVAMELGTIIEGVGVIRILVLIVSAFVLVSALMAIGRLLSGLLKRDISKERKPKADR